MIRPSGPGGQFSSDNAEKMAQEILATDPNDTHGNYRRFVLQDRLKRDYDKYVRGANGIDAYRDGILHFVHDYGTTGLFAVLPSTKAATGQSAVQATNDVWHFRSTEPEAYRNNQDVIGYFFAQGGFTQPGDQGPSASPLPMYQGQKQAGERVQKQQDFIDDAMREYGWMLWNPKAKEIDAMPLDEKGIAAAKDALAAQITELTGGAWARGMSSSVKTETVIKHMEDALEDDAVKSLNSAPYIATYLQKRRDVIEALRAKGSAANLSAKKNQAEVLPLITLAQQLIQQDGTGAFNNAWNRVFIDEFKGRLRCPQRTRVAPTSVCPTTTGSRSATRDPRSTTRSPGTTATTSRPTRVCTGRRSTRTRCSTRCWARGRSRSSPGRWPRTISATCRRTSPVSSRTAPRTP